MEKPKSTTEVLESLPCFQAPSPAAEPHFTSYFLHAVNSSLTVFHVEGKAADFVIDHYPSGQKCPATLFDLNFFYDKNFPLDGKPVTDNNNYCPCSWTISLVHGCYETPDFFSQQCMASLGHI